MKRVKLNKDRFALVDDADYPLVAQHKWYYAPNQWGGYAYCRIKGKTKYLHRLLLDAPKGIEVDHRNHDTLDNRRSNLRLATPSQNRTNSRLRSDNTTGYKGVHYYKKSRNWVAAIHLPGHRKVHLGCFNNPVSAAYAYNEAAIEHFGEFAYLNKIKAV